MPHRKYFSYFQHEAFKLLEISLTEPQGRGERRHGSGSGGKHPNPKCSAPSPHGLLKSSKFMGSGHAKSTLKGRLDNTLNEETSGKKI